MSFNKLIVPGVEALKIFLKENGSKNFYCRYLKNVDAMMGNNDGIDFIERFEIKYYENNEEFNILD